MGRVAPPLLNQGSRFEITSGDSNRALVQLMFPGATPPPRRAKLVGAPPRTRPRPRWFRIALGRVVLLILAGACAAPKGPGLTAPAPPPGPPPPSAPSPAQAPQAADPFAPPDRTQPPWSQTPVKLLGIGEVETGTAAGGSTWRIGTARGTIWVWRPAGYRPRDAGVVVYLHGYYTTVDQAVIDHRLAEQFAAGGRDAIHMAAEAPAWNGEEGVWPDLDELLAVAFRGARLKPPRGPVVVVGHSGAFRPILAWLGHPRLEEIVLLDGLYRGEAQFRTWLMGAGPQAHHRLVLVSGETLSAGVALAASVPGAVSLPEVPAPDRGLEGAARTARLVHLKSQLDHMAIVESGEVLPPLLRASHLAPLN